MARPDTKELAAWFSDPDHYDPRVLRALAYIAELEGLLREVADSNLAVPEYYGGEYESEIHVCPFCGGDRLDNSHVLPRTDHATDCPLSRIAALNLEQPPPPASEQP